MAAMNSCQLLAVASGDPRFRQQDETVILPVKITRRFNSKREQRIVEEFVEIELEIRGGASQYVSDKVREGSLLLIEGGISMSDEACPHCGNHQHFITTRSVSNLSRKPE